VQHGAPRWLGAIVTAGMMLAGCSSALPSRDVPAAPPSPAASVVATDTPVACPPPVADSSPSPAEPGVWPGPNPPAGLSSAIEAETAELVAAIGNPDTGSRSPAWDAFESALTGGDPATIRASAETVIGHLRAACEAVAAYFDEPSADAWSADVRGLLDGLALAVAALRDGGVGHDNAALEAAREQLQAVLLDHFYQSFKMSDPAAWRVGLPSSGWSATASHVRWLTGEVGAALDGRADTMWLAGDVPSPQWIEVDFGAELGVSGIRLLTYQETGGATDHRVTVRTATGKETELVRFSGDTRDGQWLEFTAPSPVEQIRYVRVTTLASPSTIGWRELEVTLAAAAAPSPCPASTTIVTDIAKTAASPSAQASDPGLAVDGDQSTGWDPGPVGGVDGARGWIRVWYASEVRISEVRVLLGPGSVAATYEVVLFPPGESGSGLGTLKPVPAGGGWVPLAGPNPCLPYESVYIFVRSAEPAGIVREIQVTGNHVDGGGSEIPARVLATSEVPLNGIFGTVDPAQDVVTAGVRNSETNLGDLAADAMLWQARQRAAALAVDSPQVALLNGGAIRNASVIPPGPITERDTSSILPFTDDIVSIKEDVPADIFKAILETSVSEIGNPQFGQWAGLTFSYDPGASKRVIDLQTCAVSEPGSRVRDVSVGGARIFDDGVFVGPAGWTVDVAANDYTLRGGDCYSFGSGGFTGVGASYTEALVNYLVAPTSDGGLQGVITAVDYPAGGEGRIVRLP
jgi:hypothetical protein